MLDLSEMIALQRNSYRNILEKLHPPLTQHPR